MHKDEVEDSEEIDESLTKAEIARNIVEMHERHDEEAVNEFASSLQEEEMPKKKKDDEDEEEEVAEEDDKEDDEDEDEDDEEVKESNKVESELVEMEIEDGLEKISEALNFQKKIQEKARTIFKAGIFKSFRNQRTTRIRVFRKFKNLNRKC